MSAIQEVRTPNPEEFLGKEGAVYQATGLEDGATATLTLTKAERKERFGDRAYTLEFESDGPPLAQMIFRLESDGEAPSDLFLVSRPAPNGKSCFEANFN